MMPPRRRDQREPSPESLLRIAERGDLLDDADIQKLVSVATVTDSTALKRRIEKLLAGKALQRQVQPFDIDTAPPLQVDPQLTLGTTLTGSRYDLSQDDLTQHLLTVGQSGAGKTTLFYNMMAQLAVPFWVFDLKQDYRHLLHDRDDLLVLPWTELKFNPLQPPEGVPPRRWIQVIAEIFGHATALLSGSKNYLMKALSDLYNAYDLFDEVAAPYPSFYELQRIAETDKINYMRTTSDYRDRILNRVEAMTLTAGSIFDCNEGYPIEDLVQRNVVFEFDGLSTDLQNFLMEILFASVYEYRVAQTQRGGGLRHVFFLDEGKQVFSIYKERQDASGIPTIDELTAKMREFGEGLVVADQEASKLTDSIKANTATKVLLATGDARQFEEMTASMHLSPRQQDLAQQVGVGEAIIQTGNRDPVPVDLDNYALEKTISDADLRDRQEKTWNKISATPRDIPVAFEEQVPDAAGETAVPEDTLSGVDLSDDAERLLNDVAEHPFTPLTARYEALFSSRGKGDAPKNELVDKGIVVERQVKTGPQRKLLQLTEKGREYVEQHEKMELQRKGRGGIVHQFWQKLITDAFEDLGWTAKRELFDADVYVMIEGVELVVEVAMGDNEREVEHVAEHVDTFDVAWVACRSAQVRDGLAARLEEQGLREQVALKLCKEFFEPDDVSL